MAMVEVLLGILTIGVTVVIALISSLYREILVNVKPDVQSMRAVLFGVAEDDTDSGLVHTVDDVDDKIEQNAIDRKEEHEQVDKRLNRIQNRVDNVVDAINQSESVTVDVDANGQNSTDD